MREFNTQFLKISLIIILFLFPSVCFSIEVKRSFIAWGTNLDFIVQSNKSTEEIDNIIRETADTAYHPSCTNKMGVDRMSVVDEETRVHGVGNLRVIDSSIMPDILSGNLNAGTIMIAEKAADMIKEDQKI